MTSIPAQCGRCGKSYALAWEKDDMDDDPEELVENDPMITTAHEDGGVVFFHA